MVLLVVLSHPQRNQALCLVIGLPLNLDGSDSPRTQSTRAFARNLAPLGLPVLLWDERWSTQAVTRTLLEADASRARRDTDGRRRSGVFWSRDRGGEPTDIKAGCAAVATASIA